MREVTTAEVGVSFVAISQFSCLFSLCLCVRGCGSGVRAEVVGLWARGQPVGWREGYNSAGEVRDF